MMGCMTVSAASPFRSRKRGLELAVESLAGRNDDADAVYNSWKAQIYSISSCRVRANTTTSFTLL